MTPRLALPMIKLSGTDRYRPDILIATEGKACQGDIIQQFYGHTIHIVEVKYCRDTDKSTQALRATQQHEALKEALLKVGYKPEQVHMCEVLEQEGSRS
jgi:hypothetical protein